jgi:uncharacterized membrane protein
MTELSPEMWLVAGSMFVLLVMILMVYSSVWRHRRTERVQRWKQLEAVHNARERRQRGN